MSEAQIAVHWREEEYYPPPRSSSRRRTRTIRRSSSASASSTFPDCFIEYAEMLTWDRKWDTILDTSNPPFWKWWVGGRLNACVNCVDRHLDSRGDENALIWVPELRGRGDAGDHLRGSPPAGQRVRRAAEGLRRRQDRRPGHVPPADGPRAAGVDARLRAHRRDPFRGVRRLQRDRLWPADGRRAKHDPGDDGRLLPQRRADRPQGQGRRRDRGRARGGARGREGARLAAASRANTTRRARWSRAATSSSTSCSSNYRGTAGRARVDARGGAAVLDVHERHDRPAEGLPALDRGLPELRRPAPRSTTRTSTPTTPTGALPTSAGSPATPTSSTGRSRSGRRA